MNLARVLFGAAPPEEAVPTWVLVVLLACQALVAVAFFLMGYLGARGKLPRNAFFGLRTDQSRADDAAWAHVHREAAPFAYAASAALAAGLVAMAVTTESEAAFLIALLLPYPIAGAFTGLAIWRGHRDLPVR